MGYRLSYNPGSQDVFGGAPARGHRQRLRFLSWCFLAVFCAVLLRLAKVHVLPDAELAWEEKAHVGQRELRVPRGDIVDHEGALLAKDRPTFSISADPQALVDTDLLADELQRCMGIDQSVFRDRVAKAIEAKKSFVWVKRWLSDYELRGFNTMDPMLKNLLTLRPESVRYYPEGDLASHLLGFVDRDGFGRAGIEKACDVYLRSVPGKQTTRVDAKRRVLASLTLEYVLPEGGDTVCLTIDKAIQRTLEMEIDKALVQSQAPRGMGMVMDPYTGAILAMTCRPSFNPNTYADTPPEEYKDRATIDVFEPGSTFKIVTASAALEHGLVTPDTRIDCENGGFNPYGHYIRDYHKLGVEPFSSCFANSSNVALIKVGAMLGPERLEQWIRRFGFGAKTSPDFSPESPGLLRPRKNWSKLSMGSLPMGQEIAVTMPQLARAFGVIANGGFLVDPYLVERTVDREGNVTYQHTPKDPQRILSERTAKTMQALCHLVVLDGTGKPASIPEYRVGGKTGTAQIAIQGQKGFVPNKFTAIFAGFAPVSSPRLVSVIIVQEPEIKLHFGGTICGPVFKEVVRDALIRLNVPKDPMGSAPGSVEEVLEDEDTVVARADSPVTDMQTAEAIGDGNASSLGGDPLALVKSQAAAGEGQAVLPSLMGLSKRQAKECLDALGVSWDPQGAGRVVAQEPAAGTSLSEVTLCKLVFSNESKSETPSPPVSAASVSDSPKPPAKKTTTASPGKKKDEVKRPAKLARR